ncbi:membrane metallo-endopeptidase-like 1 isoform X2 [Babylonia areolata]|uniref:membrane metallo-endopeptidase-like 1 isoform X2 n=1 Tax=Babylonia areolata TaxID=304850 RepID=UPI003FD498F4
MSTSLRKSSNFADGLSGVRYTPTSAEEDPEDSCCSDTTTGGKLAFVRGLGGVSTAGGSPGCGSLSGPGPGPGPEAAPMNGDVVHSSGGRSLSSSTAATSPPVSASLLNATFPYYDYQDTEDENDESEEGEEEGEEEEGGGCDIVGGEDRPSPTSSSSTRLPNGHPHQHSSTTTPMHHPYHDHQNNNHHQHHPHLGEKISGDSSDLYNNHPHHNNHHQHHNNQYQHHPQGHRDSRILRELSKSSLSRRSARAGGKGRCLCCMMCIFLLSTAGLGAVLALTYAGKVDLGPDPSSSSSSSSSSTSHTAHSNGGASGVSGGGRRRPGGSGGNGGGHSTVHRCESRGCMESAAAILGRMNTSVNPCVDFYSYACGGYNQKTYLSWFSTRIRENPEEIIQHFRHYAIDRLSSSYTVKDGPYVNKARTLFRSCLFRPHSVDERTRNIVASVVESLGGLTMPDNGGGSGGFDLTPLVANVTRLYGASPFFKIHIRGPKRVAIQTRMSDYRDPLVSSPHVLSRSLDSRPQKTFPGPEKTLEDLLLSLLAGVNYTGDIRVVVRDFLRLQANIRRTFNEDSHLSDDATADPTCDEFSRSSLAELQFRHGTYGLNWTELVLGVLDLATSRDVVICEVRLSRPMQHLLEITPPEQLWQFAILHTLLHSDLFLIVSGRRPRARDFHPFSFRSSSISSSSSSSSSSGSGGGVGGEEQEEITKPSPEEQCLDLLDYVMPSLKSSLHCHPDALMSSGRQADFLLEHLRLSLFNILKGLFRISAESSWRVTNTTVNRVKMDVLLYLKSLEVRHDEALKEVGLDEYDWAGNLLELVRYRNQVYFQGTLHLGDYPDHVTAFGIQACFEEESSVTRPGPQLYHATVPYAVRFGSMGTYLASQVAEKLGIEDLLDHYSDGVLNHSAVLGLAVRLQCFVEKYSHINLLDYGSQSYKVNGESNRVHLWKDQLALQMISKAWGSFHRMMTTDQVLPGLSLSADQLFFLAHAQTQCEKVSERGILQHYVNKDHQMPNKHRVNEPLRNLHEFYRAFHCGNSKDVCDLF